MSRPALLEQAPSNATNLASECSLRRLFIINVRVSYAHRKMAEELATLDHVPLATVIEQALSRLSLEGQRMPA